jgi:signal transduction histidine kinase
MVKLGLRGKFILYSNTVIAVTMAIATVLAAMHDRTTHYTAMRDHARSVAGALAIAITDALMYEDLGLVQDAGLTDNYISEIMRQHQDHLRYVVVTNPEGIVTHSSRWHMLGDRFVRDVSAEELQNGPVERARFEDGERLTEVSVPLNISTKSWGALALGYSLEPIEQELTDFTWRLIQVALLLILINSLLTMVYVESLIRPVLRLHQNMRRAAAGDLAARVWARSGDEVAELGNTFNSMMDELEEARDREKTRQSQLVHTEKMAALGTLAAGVAHEVNNPLGGILGCIENMRADPENRDMRERYLTLIHDGLRRIERTVANLLDFSRRRELRREPTSLNYCLQHVAELASYHLRKGSVELRLQLDPEVPAILADHFQIEQLLLNLVLNAVQAMPGGGTLTLRTGRHEQSVYAEVRDTGSGIPDAIRGRIFDPFFTTRSVGEGTGLGLAVSDSIAAAHGGHLEVESAVGRGSVFRVVLPVRPLHDEPMGETA